jgi:hypothetical protein
VSYEKKKLPTMLLQAARDQLIFRIRNRLGSLLVTDDMKIIYPFLKDLPKTLKDYMSCLKVDQQGEPGDCTVVLVVDRARLERLGYPANLADIFEYGNQTMPPCTHIRTVKTGFSHLATLMKKRVMAECKSS